jgi:hypothetical protein
MALLSGQTEDEQSSCIELSVHEIVFSRTTLIIVLTLCVAITGISVIGISALGYRTWTRHQKDKEARGRGRSPQYHQRIPMMRKEADDSYSHQYSGYSISEPGNRSPAPDCSPAPNRSPAPRTPVELMHNEVWEAPGSEVSSEPTMARDGRETKVKSLLFDAAKGQWMHRHN